MVSRLKRLGLIAVWLGFTAVGVVMVASDADGAGLTGLAIILFCGAGGLMWYLLTRPRTGPTAGLRAAMVTYRGQSRPAFVADYDRGRVLTASGGPLAFAAGGALIAVSSFGSPEEIGTLLVGMACVALFGGIGVLGLIRARTGSQLALMRDGLLATGPGGATFVPWDGISDVGEVEMSRNRFIAVRASHPSRIETGRLSGLVGKLQRSMTGADLTYPVSSLVGSAELLDAIRRYVSRPEVRVHIGDTRELATLRAAIATGTEATSADPAREAVPLRTTLAAGSLIVVGALFVLFSLAAIFGGGAPEQRTARMLGGVLFALLGLAQLSAAALVIRGARIARWPGIGAPLVIVGLAILGLIGADADVRAIGFLVAAIAVVHAMLVIWGLGGASWYATAGDSRGTTVSDRSRT